MSPHSTTLRSRRTATRLGVVGLLTALVLGALALIGPSAQAAWTTGVQAHGGKVVVCKTNLGDGRFRIKGRLDNRGAKHTHTGAVSRIHGNKLVANLSFRAAAGRTSATKSLVWTRAQRQRGEVLSVGFGEAAGIGMGGDVPFGAIRAC
ncbi:hypothetical protein FXB39_03310 [Nocardioides sp. BGMRC 2183]|nr:hypothetical protein FXB39_03310 [Nocardioides sp. BGMRC 2183]